MTKVKGVWLKADGSIYGWDAQKICNHLRELAQAIEQSPFPYVVVEWQEANGGYGLIGFENDPVPAKNAIPVIYKETNSQ
jgi:hypothetical protein